MLNAIVTHGGRAHYDEVIAIALLLGHFYSRNQVAEVRKLEILRRKPVPIELNDPLTAVVDIGERYEPARLNFDHHQLTWPAKTHLPLRPRNCAASLVVDWLQLEELRPLPWLDTLAHADNEGWGAALAPLGITPERLAIAMPPLDRWILKLFEDGEYPMNELLWQIGRGFISDLKELAENLKVFEATTVFHRYEFETGQTGFAAYNDQARSLKGFDAFCGEWSKKHGRHVLGTILLDHSEDKWGFKRLGNPAVLRVDFRKIKDEPGVKFVHSSGFMAKCENSPLVDPIDLFAIACGGKLVKVEAEAPVAEEPAPESSPEVKPEA